MPGPPFISGFFLLINPVDLVISPVFLPGRYSLLLDIDTVRLKPPNIGMNSIDG